ncbi:hypothetical protein FHS43_003361 [Streptosporangium becharense]|uniref:DUF4386 domain-containing protein n=1 Tax=Streptosporangium becharense TaxID=1816182 RepID=A0A7W9IDB9_9ACTN|nr:hypothetical protein [Streptosporangium becharense]MBB2912081.1 hypothetical protein [Streptosporangium becharense]MBB5818628.1 hypothetical protein [Streptosporangium becharense]
MSVLSDPLRFRRSAAGLCLIAAPLVYVVGIVVDPNLRLGGVEESLGIYGRYPEQVSVSASLLHWSWVLLIPGIIGMIHLIRRRAVVFGHIAGGIALLGIVNLSGLMLGDFFYSRLERDLPPQQGADLADLAFADPGVLIAFQIPAFTGLLGLLLLGLALAYEGQAPWWAPVAMVVGSIGATVFPIGTVVGGLLYLAGSGVIGLRMLRMSDAEWAGEAAPQPVSVAVPSGNRAATR